MLIKLFVLNCVSEGYSGAVYIVLPFKQCGALFLFQYRETG